MEIQYLKSIGQEATESNGVLEFRKKASGAFLMAGISVVAYFLFRGLGALEIGSSDKGEGLFSFGIANLVLLLGALTFLAGILMVLTPGRQAYARLDFTRRTLTRRKKVVPFDQIARFEVNGFGRHNVRLSAFTVTGETIGLWVDLGRKQAAMLALAARLNEALQTDAPVTSFVGAETSNREHDRMQGWIAIVFAIVWSVGGYFFFNGLYYVSRSHPDTDPFPIPIWAAGLIGFPLGIYKLWIAHRKRNQALIERK